jgi:hypothetical protein
MTPLTAPIAATTPSPPPSIPFALPMMTYFMITKHPHGAVAHALDFDLVSVAASAEAAMTKLRKAVKAHVKFGIQEDLTKDILFKAPDRFWATLTPDATLSIGEPIEIESTYMIRMAYTTQTDETELCSSTA